MNNYEEVNRKFANIITLNDREKSILESLRYTDSDQSVKAGAVLAFSGLMITSAVVQLSVSESSPLLLHRNSFLIYVSMTGFYFLFISSFMALRSLTVSFKEYSQNIEKALLQFNNLINERSEWNKYSIRCSMFGAFNVLISFFGSILT